MGQKKSFYTFQFWLLCTSSVLFMASFNMIIPELPSYLDAMGGEDYKGLIIGLFASTALISRPFSGRLADTIGRIPVMIIGPLVCVTLGLLYPAFTTIWGFLFLRILHGFSTGFKPTGTTAYLADIVSSKNRGEAMGILGVAGSIGMAAGPAIGSYIAMEFSLNAMFYASSFTALLSVLVLFGMKETLQDKVKFKPSLLLIHPRDVVEPRVIQPSIIMFLSVYAFGTVLTVTPDLSDHLGIGNRGLFFTATLLASVVTRLFAGKASDRFGREKIMMIGMTLLIASTILLGFSDTPQLFYMSAAIYGIAAGINSPTLFAWTVDLADELNRGKGMSTMFIALELGVILGSIFGAEIYDNDVTRFKYAFWFSSFMATLGLSYLIRLLALKSSKSASLT